ncbi:adenosylcobalamin-dependent ribonucleoside-diphosphate reductase [Methanolacinia paynteri]|uniref:adenosylcobalamin-dependent ribonucleoside-diphosphate reductase n=1 Tax=Methanolacinia paynteri TaxID=230356 RepID=UPI00064E7287|nr:adenosylcobalamin-dependent ribonucleoside-diphosphate reductase [Methanolacinia paynteri]
MTSEAAERILRLRYYRDDEKSFDELCRRVAGAIADSPEEEAEYFDMMNTLRFLPNSPTLMNAGTDMNQLAACFTLYVGDSITEIFDAMKWGAMIHKSGGGTGYNFSNIRPEGAFVESSEGVASGPVSFMKAFDAVTGVIRQGGRRRGANMGILNVDHPDILKFINSKTREGDIANFNISVMVTDRFIGLVEAGRFDRVWITREETAEEITVGDIWNGIIEGIWRNGEPGLLFYDEINRKNMTPALGNINATNPCGEQPLLPFESCVLGSINLSKFIDEKGETDLPSLEKTVRTAVKFLDRIIDKNRYPIPEIEEATKRTRKVGLGLMGVHDALIMRRTPYDSPEGRKYCGSIMQFVAETAVSESGRLAEEKGPFSAWKGSVWDKNGKMVRNAALTTIAPTGSISIIAECSSGIEPVFSYSYTRMNTAGESFRMVHPLFKKELETVAGKLFPNPEEREMRVAEVISHVHETGTVQDIGWLPDSFTDIFTTALDIRWRDHILMQAAFQEHVHASISKTINMPGTATKNEISEALLFAWRCRLKGITIYRTSSRKDAVLCLGKFGNGHC